MGEGVRITWEKAEVTYPFPPIKTTMALPCPFLSRRIEVTIPMGTLVCLLGLDTSRSHMGFPTSTPHPVMS